MKQILLFTALIFSWVASAQVLEQKGNPDIQKGYFDFIFDEDSGKIWMQIDRLNEEFLYVNYLSAGLGSNDIGLDRNQIGDSRIVFFEKRGQKIFLVQPNKDYIARTDNAKERNSVADAFASSILFSFDIEEEKEGSYLINFRPFLIRDAHGVVETLKSGGQGTYSLDKDRSALYPDGIFNFPKNSEFEAILTFEGQPRGKEVYSVTPSASSITLRQHHSFVQLPDDNYEPRKYDPRSGFIPTSFMDYAAPIDQPMLVQYVNRHRLEKLNPEAAISEAVEPIIYYLDNGTPEPIRSALVDGALWWNQAFETAGYKDAFQVRILPDSIHPLDIRYNVINWVHRSTRGWSYGGSVVDPRTGEIIKGSVLLGSLRVRQDYLIATGLLSPFKEGVEEDPRMLEMALARIRQLSAHEVGHTLGLMHNFASSTNSRASVMDYPHPKVEIIPDGLRLDDAYAKGIGEWDKTTILFGYQDFPENSNKQELLDQILEEARTKGQRYISDDDSRPRGSSHPYAHLWDNGTDARKELMHVMRVRRMALSQFGEASIPEGMSLAQLQDVLVPIYFFHRYQVEATAKLIGGVEYSYSMKGEENSGLKIVPQETQEAALEALLSTLQPDQLALPESLLRIIPPRPPGVPYSRELMRGNTSPTIDALSIAEASAGMVISLLLNPERTNRLVEHSAREQGIELEELIEELVAVGWEEEYEDPYQKAVRQVVGYSTVVHLIRLHASSRTNPMTKSIVLGQIKELRKKLSNSSLPMAEQSSFVILEYLSNPRALFFGRSLSLPPGSPIGMDWIEYCGY